MGDYRKTFFPKDGFTAAPEVSSSKMESTQAPEGRA